MSQLTKSELVQIPKVELHRHLEGAVRLSTLKELAPQMGLDLPIHDEKKLKAALLVTEPMKDLESVLNKFWTTQSMLASEEILERITYEACEDAYREGIRILELRYSPSFIATNHSQFSYDTIHRAIVKGMNRGMKDFPMAVGLIGIIGRVMPLTEAAHVADFIIDHKDGFIAMDLADNEVGFDCKPFAPFFMKAKKAGLHITVHSGEANVPGAHNFVRDAIDLLGSERIGHGVQIYKDTPTVEYVKKTGTVLELCPTSNWYTNAVTSLRAHPFRQLMQAGVRVTLNSDDPGIFDIDLVNEFEVLSRELAFTREEFERLGDEGARASFLPLELKQKYWPRKILG